jgi:hypothetical protein
MGQSNSYYPEHEKMVDVFERNIPRRIYGHMKGRDQWRCRFNKDLYLFKKNRNSEW